MKRKRRFCWIGHSEKQQHIGKFFWKKTKEIMAGLKAQELRTHKSHANDMEGNTRDTKVFNYFFLQHLHYCWCCRETDFHGWGIQVYCQSSSHNVKAKIFILPLLAQEIVSAVCDFSQTRRLKSYVAAQNFYKWYHPVQFSKQWQTTEHRTSGQQITIKWQISKIAQ